MAEHMYPIITPLMTSMDIFFTLLEMSRMKPMEIMAPTKAAAIRARELAKRPWLSRKIITRDTASLAPEEMPRTKGPAMGFAKKVWSRKPETDSAPPRSMAERIRGSRISQTICDCVLSAPCPVRMRRISPTGR